MILLTFPLALFISRQPLEPFTLFLLAAASLALLSLRVRGPLRLFFVGVALMALLGILAIVRGGDLRLLVAGLNEDAVIGTSLRQGFAIVRAAVCNK